MDTLTETWGLNVFCYYSYIVYYDIFIKVLIIIELYYLSDMK